MILVWFKLLCFPRIWKLEILHEVWALTFCDSYFWHKLWVSTCESTKLGFVERTKAWNKWALKEDLNFSILLKKLMLLVQSSEIFYKRMQSFYWKIEILRISLEDEESYWIICFKRILIVLTWFGFLFRIWFLLLV